jgi:tetratricopeptide (TPR) repeat protein
MSLADSEMQNKDYKKATEYYKSAIKNKPGDKDAVMGYASAAMSDASVNIIDFAINNISNLDNPDLLQNLMAEILSDDKVTRLDELLKELTNNTAMFPSLFGGPTPPTDVATNFNGALIYALAAVVSVREHIPDPNKINLDTLPDMLNALNGTTIPKKYLQEADINLSKALKCLSNINDTNPTMEDFKMKLQFIKTSLSTILQCNEY